MYLYNFKGDLTLAKGEGEFKDNSFSQINMTGNGVLIYSEAESVSININQLSVKCSETYS